MSMQSILEQLALAQDGSLDIESRVRHLSLAGTALIPSNEADELLETFLALHVDAERTFRRFSGLFIYQLVSGRSVFACRCLQTLTKLLHDSDEATVSLGLKAAAAVYPRALHWTAVQARDAQYLNASAENMSRLEQLLSRVVDLLSDARFFGLALATVVSVILCQSKSHSHPRSFTQLEAEGVGGLEDLRLDLMQTGLGGSGLSGPRLQQQADRLLEFLCVSLVEKHGALMANTEQLFGLIDAVVAVAAARPDYCMAVILSLEAVARESGSGVGVSESVRAFVVDRLKNRLLASRPCVNFHSEILKTLRSLNESVEDVELAVFKSQLRAQAEARSSLSVGANPVMDAEHAVAVLSIRARDAGELAKLALNLLGRLPTSDPKGGRVRVSRLDAGVVEPSTVGGTFVSQAETDELLQSAVLQGTMLATSAAADLSGEMVTSEDDDEARREGRVAKRRRQEEDPVVHLDPTIGDSALVLWPTERRRKLRSVSLALQTESLDTALGLLSSATLARDWSGATDLLLLMRGKFGKEVYVGHIVEIFAAGLSKALDSAEAVRRCKEECLLMMPEVSESLVAVLETLANQADAIVRRQALAAIAALFLTKPRGREACVHALLRCCANPDAAVATDAVKLISLKLYQPLVGEREGQPKAGSLAFFRSQFLEEAAMTLLAPQSSNSVASETPLSVRCGLFVALTTQSPRLLAAGFGLLEQNPDLLQQILSGIVAEEPALAVVVSLVQQVAATSVLVDLLVNLIQHIPDMFDLKPILIATVVGRLRERNVAAALFPVLGLLDVQEILGTVLGVVGSGSTAEAEHAVEEGMKYLSHGANLESAASLVTGILRMGSDAAKLPNVMTAMNKLFTIKDRFEAGRVLSIVIYSVAEDDPLPPPYLRLCIQTLQAFPDMEMFVASEILGRLVRPGVYDDAMHWRGLCLVLSQLLSSQDASVRARACEVCGHLPATKVSELVGRRKDIKTILRDWVVQQPFGTLADLRRILME